MAFHKGLEGIVKVGGSPAVVAEMREWSLETTGDVTESTSIPTAQSNGGWKTNAATLKSWAGSTKCWWDETDTSGQQTIDVGTTVALKMYPEGDGSGATFFSGDAIVTGVTRSAAIDGLVEADFTFTGTGALSETTVGA